MLIIWTFSYWGNPTLPTHPPPHLLCSLVGALLEEVLERGLETSLQRGLLPPRKTHWLPLFGGTLCGVRVLCANYRAGWGG